MIDIIQNITNFLDIYDQIKILQLNTYIYDNLKIFTLDIKNIKLSNKLTQKIIEQHKFSFLKKLNITFTKIHNVNFLKNSLLELNCRFNGISDGAIKDLYRLQKLDINFNNNIKNVNYFSNTLLHLNCANTKLDNNSFDKCIKLVYLDISNNKNINNIDTLINLKTLKSNNSLFKN